MVFELFIRILVQILIKLWLEFFILRGDKMYKVRCTKKQIGRLDESPGFL